MDSAPPDLSTSPVTSSPYFLLNYSCIMALVASPTDNLKFLQAFWKVEELPSPPSTLNDVDVQTVDTCCDYPSSPVHAY